MPQPWQIELIGFGMEIAALVIALDAHRRFRFARDRIEALERAVGLWGE